MTSTRPSESRVAVWSVRAATGVAARAEVSETGSNISAWITIPFWLSPPTIKTFPSSNSVAVWPRRSTLSWAVPTICAKAGTAETLLRSRPTMAINAHIASRLPGRRACRGGARRRGYFIWASRKLFIAVSLVHDSLTSFTTKKTGTEFLCCRFHHSLPNSRGDHVGISVHRVNE